MFSLLLYVSCTYDYVRIASCLLRLWIHSSNRLIFSDKVSYEIAAITRYLRDQALLLMQSPMTNNKTGCRRRGSAQSNKSVVCNLLIETILDRSLRHPNDIGCDAAFHWPDPLSKRTITQVNMIIVSKRHFSS